MRFLFIILLFPFLTEAQVKINGTGRTVTLNAPGQPSTVNIVTPEPTVDPTKTIFNSQSESFVDGFDYTEDSELTVTSSQLSYSGTTTKTLDLLYDNSNLYHQYEKWEVRTTVTLGAMTSNQNGFMIGLKSSNANQATGFHIKCAATSNTWAIQPMQNGSSAGSATTGHSYTPGASIDIIVTRSLTTFEITVDDGTTPVNVSVDIGFSPYSTWALPSIITEFSIYFYTGTFTVTDYYAFLPEHSISCLFFGDSITQGQGSDTYASSYAQLFKEIFPDGQAFGGRSGKTADLLLTIPAIELIAPEKVTIMAGINDILTSVPLATIQTNYAAIISGLQAAGIEVIILSILPNGNNVVTMNDWFQSTYPALQYIDLWSALKNPATINMDVMYSSDAVHPNEAGHLKIFETFETDYTP